MARGVTLGEVNVNRREREQLESLARSRSLPAGLVTRARIIDSVRRAKRISKLPRQLNMCQATVGTGGGGFCKAMWPGCRTSCGRGSRDLSAMSG